MKSIIVHIVIREFVGVAEVHFMMIGIAIVASSFPVWNSLSSSNNLNY